MLIENVLDIPTPCHLIDIDKVISNIEVINKICKKTDMILLLAVKGFSNDKIIKYFIDRVDGVSASSLWEARLGKEVLGTSVHTFSTAYTMRNIQPVCKYSDYVIFNSIHHLQEFGDIVKRMKRHCGLRINPEYSEIVNDAINPCHYASRFGVRAQELMKINCNAIDGFHFHNMNEQYSDTFLRTIRKIEKDFGDYLYRVQWLNIGGGQFFSDEAYNLQDFVHIINYVQNKYSLQIIAEPCEAIMLNAGYFVATVTDIIENKLSTAILDASAICHLPETVSLPYRSEIQNAALPYEKQFTYRIAGATCYAGDIFGDYSFDFPLEVGTKIVFCDTAPYTMVRVNLFNGVQLPYYATISKNSGIKVQKIYDFNTFLALI